MEYIELGGARVPLEANIGFQQTYDDAQQRKEKFYANGEPIRLHSNVARKLKTEFGASNAIWPDCFDGLDWDAVHLLKCARPRLVHGATNVISIPASRRSDTGYEPFAAATVNNRKVSIGIASVSTDQYTLDTVAGASDYTVGYYPQFYVLASKKSTGKYGWLISAIEKTP